MTARPFQIADEPAVNALHRSVWWPDRSREGWRWLRSNPAAGDAAFGWVVDDRDGNVAAFAGNFVQNFWLGDRPLRAATGFSIIATSVARGASRTLIPAVLDQPGVDWVFTLNANPVSQPLYGRHGMAPLPADSFQAKLSWPIDRVALGEAWLLRRAAVRAPGMTARRIGERLMNGRVGRLCYDDLPPTVAPLLDLGDRSAYAEFWRTLKAEGRLLADRSPETLRWRLADPDRVRDPLLLAWWSGGRIGGVAQALIGKMDGLAAPVLEIIDLEALEDAPEAVPALVEALRGMARPAGVAKVRLQVLSPRTLARLGRHAVKARLEGGWGHVFHKTAKGAEELAHLWEPTPFDGDYGFCTRPAPLPARGIVGWSGVQPSSAPSTALARGARRFGLASPVSLAAAGALERVRKPGSALGASSDA